MRFISFPPQSCTREMVVFAHDTIPQAHAELSRGGRRDVLGGISNVAANMKTAAFAGGNFRRVPRVHGGLGRLRAYPLARVAFPLPDLLPDHIRRCRYRDIAHDVYTQRVDKR